ncbi:HAMP domain-containing sensor histidine kinase [Paucibacter sp. AS339]|uniref:sensor histidine kinase n=1 Tax=Paucibacter hankyongi TaxID=3133434 RepID=UPI00309DA2FB
MFRARLLLAISLLGVLALMEGGVALWAQHTAHWQVQRGRLSSDILKGFVELSANKQRLRSWTAQRLLAADASPTVRDRLISDMREGLRELHDLAVQLDELESGQVKSVRTAPLGDRSAERRQSLQVLDRHLDELIRVLAAVQPLAEGADGRLAWARLSGLFDQSQGQDLRRLLNAEIVAEREATQRSRAAADRALSTMRRTVLAISLTALLAAAWLAFYFMRRLKQPIDDLSHGALALQGGDLSHRIPERQLDEFGSVARSFNAMAAELQVRRAQDQADRVRLEEMVEARTAELREAHDTLLALDQRRRRFFADVSHELRTPVTAIRGEAEVALRGREKSVLEYQQALARIVSTVGQFSHVVEDLTLLARSDFEQLVWQQQALNWRELLQSVCEQFSVQAQAAQMQLHWSLAEVEAGQAQIRGDAKRLRQMLVIVLENALRYSHAGGRIELSARVDAGRLRVQVRDQGIGVSSEDLPHLFERHYRGQAARVHRPDGLGLGLPIAQMIAQAHAAQISMESVQGQGSCVSIDLPLSPTAEDEE